MRKRHQRRYGPFLSARGFAFLLNALTFAFLAVTVVRCIRS